MMAPILLFFLLCTAVSADEWPYPRFLPAEVENNPGHAELKCDSDNNCKVTIDEAVTELLYIVKLNYKGGASVTVKELGDTHYLKPEIKLFGGDMYIVTNTPQKYNPRVSAPLSLYITIESVTSDYLNLLVRDINNNSPILTMKDQVCPVEENSPGITSCIIMLSDEDTVCDGFQVQVFTSGSPDVSDVFVPNVKNLEKCDKEITLVVQGDKGLDYEKQRIYKLDINVTDGPNGAFERMVVDVVDMPDMPPVWEMSPTKNLVEETDYVMKLEARDGDVGLNIPLTYSINVDGDNGECSLTMEFEEGTISTLDNIIIKDMDEGNNGTYSVYLKDEPGKNFKDLFRVIPNVGYQNASFSISVTEPALLDYENEEMKHFTFELVAEEHANNSHVERCEVTVNLIDVNDENPQFTNIGDQNVTENAPDGTLITTLIAIDKDEVDILNTSVHVDESSGEVTAIGGKFDHEMQETMIIQVKVQDTANNFATGQFVLHIIDENDTPPNIFIPFGRVLIPENYSVGYVVTQEIRANDLDTSADLHFHINWDGSSATQQGTKQDLNVFMGTFAVNDSCDCKKDDYKACSCLQINKPLDWSNMDTLYLNITVTDEKTDVNAKDDSAINDTPLDLVKIDENGILTVGESNKIDYEAYQKLFYSVTAVDGDFHPYVNITIEVEDINDNPPRITSKGNPDPIKELSEPGSVFQVESEDDDVSKPFNTPTYMFDDSRNGPVIRTLFHIDNATGVITTIDKLDYLKGSEYDVWVLVRDNFLNLDASNSLTDFAKITVKVLDVNNHHPEFQEPKECEASPLEEVKKDINNHGPEFNQSIYELHVPENSTSGIKIGSVIAVDKKDGPGNNNGSFIVQVQATDQDTEPDFKDVLYSITDIISVTAPKDPPNNLFTIDENSGKIQAGMNLSGYIGNYNITVMGRNKDKITPQNTSQSFTICVQDINDHSPSIIFPTDGQIIQLQEKVKQFNKEN
ncbi:hypothetical protein J437_LFUL012102 [Ladona fulva]|uniref:Cadherin domain-containing protein n=1 Tax=Ladona fulva TaxID=123851 RepID=A0A8K0KCC0_LADFU|nr:hypothetical protein J437_LFUL012102 [Ladona fulva]